MKSVEEQIEDVKRRKVVGAVLAIQRRFTRELDRALKVDSREVGFANGSPVWTGRFLASNVVSVNQVDLRVAPETDEGVVWPDEPDSKVRWLQTEADVARVLLGLEPFGVAYISNALPYARRIEDGWSQKAPEGVYSVTLDAVLPRFLAYLNGLEVNDAFLNGEGIR